jgi:hypothetical protein
MRPPIVITVCDLGRIRWRQGNITARPPALAQEERTTWREAHRTGLTATMLPDQESGLQSVRCWPIHEPEWKREILRSEVVDF